MVARPAPSSEAMTAWRWPAGRRTNRMRSPARSRVRPSLTASVPSGRATKMLSVASPLGATSGSRAGAISIQTAAAAASAGSAAGHHRHRDRRRAIACWVWGKPRARSVAGRPPARPGPRGTARTPTGGGRPTPSRARAATPAGTGAGPGPTDVGRAADRRRACQAHNPQLPVLRNISLRKKAKQFHWFVSACALPIRARDRRC